MTSRLSSTGVPSRSYELSSQAADIEAIEGVRRTLNLVIRTAENGIKKIGQDRRFLPRF